MSDSMQFRMNFEASRLASFVSIAAWMWTVTPMALAKAGLYYTGEDGTTECFHCKGRITGKDLTESPTEVHKRLHPHCDFVNGKDRSNVPFNGGGAQRTNGESPKSSDEEERKLEKTKGSGNSSKSVRRGKKRNKNKKKTNNEHNDQDSCIVFDIDNDPQFKEANRVLKSEYKRLLTFIYWPRNAAVLPEDLAKAGFYYCGSDDRVQCFCCYGILKNWRAGEVPSRLHRQYFPTCPFVKGEDVGNEPMRLLTTRKMEIDDQPIARPTVRDPNRFEDIKQPGADTKNSVDTSPPLELRHEADKPKRPDLVNTAARLSTFNQWTGSIPFEHLAEAGFYYTGNEDNVKCFHCDGALRNWEPTDLPWIEHARWFPRCQFVNVHRGAAFMKYIADKYPQPNAEHLPADAQQKSRAKNGTMSSNTLVTQKVNDFMRTDTVQIVLEMGYKKDMVKKVVRKRVKRTGESFKSTHDLLLAVLDLESKMSENGGDTPEGSDEGDAEEDEELYGAVGGVASSYIDETSHNSDLSSQKEMLDELETLRRKKTCKICMDRDVCMLFQPCGHLVTCEVCSAELRQCPFCRTAIRSAVRAYMS